jgi:hypothetical protein
MEILDKIEIIECSEAGKGLAIQHGFSFALQQNKYDYIGLLMLIWQQNRFISMHFLKL